MSYEFTLKGSREEFIGADVYESKESARENARFYVHESRVAASAEVREVETGRVVGRFTRKVQS